ncbi:MAG: hypothetical protein R3E31_30860 [Chloroflexota bacterium]
MTDDKLDRLSALLDSASGTRKSKSEKPGSRLGETGITQVDARKATGAKKSEGTVVVSFRVPGYIEQVAMQAAINLRVPYAEFKKAVFYRGLEAFIRDGEQVPLHFDRNIEAELPNL